MTITLTRAQKRMVETGKGWSETGSDGWQIADVYIHDQRSKRFYRHPKSDTVIAASASPAHFSDRSGTGTTRYFTHWGYVKGSNRPPFDTKNMEQVECQ